MKDIADAVGVARSTVSKALRNDPTISRKRIEEIQSVAQKMGYQANPLVSALMSQIHDKRRSTDPHSIAWIDGWGGEHGPPPPIVSDLFAGAKQRANELGYGLESYPITEKKLSPKRLLEILKTRSQWGVIVPPIPAKLRHLGLDMEQLTGVSIGTSLLSPTMHRISPNHYQGMQLACEKLTEAGYKRIGMAISPALNERVQERWLGGFLATQHRWNPTRRIAPIFLEEMDRSNFRKWIESERPDALLAGDAFILNWAHKLRRDIRPLLASLLLEGGTEFKTGVDYQARIIGARAVEMLIGQIHRHERGCPEIVNTLNVDALWSEG